MAEAIERRAADLRRRLHRTRGEVREWNVLECPSEGTDSGTNPGTT